MGRGLITIQTHQLDAVSLTDGGTRLWIKTALLNGGGTIPEEGFVACRGAEDHHLSRLWTDGGKAVNATTRGKGEVAWLKPPKLAVAAKFERAPDDMKGFVLCDVTVQRRAGAGRRGDTIDRHRLGALLAIEQDFDGHAEDGQRFNMSRGGQNRGRQGCAH